jgi:hypothetical protein
MPIRKITAKATALVKYAWIIAPPVLLLALAGTVVTGRAAAEESDGMLCTVEQQMEQPDLCTADGPASKREEYWQMGLLPKRALPVLPLDPALADLDWGYGVVGKDTELGFYKTVEDAISGNRGKWVYKGFVYVSIVQWYDRPEGRFYRNKDGWILRGSEVAPITYQGQFNGVTLLENPERPFGWIVSDKGAYPSRLPGGPADEQATYYPRYSKTEIFDTQQTDSGTWYMVGINQWIEEAKIGVVFPNAARPLEIPAGVKWIYVDLFQQTLTAYEGDRMAFTTLAATGVWGTWTRPGVFHIRKKYESTLMAGSSTQDKSDYYYLENVPWTMYFDKSRAIHGNYWHNKMGAPHSHGCVNVTVADAHWLFDWAPEGTWVYVFDPSGKTPTDDESYKNDAGEP